MGPFVKGMGEKMQYRVALDDKAGSDKGKMSETWMDAAGQNGIPTAFVVDTNGIIVWIGHPMTLEDKVLDAVLAGTFDTKQAVAAAAEVQNRQAVLEKLSGEFEAAVRSGQWDTASQKLDELAKHLTPEQQAGLVLPRYGIAVGQKDYKKANQVAREGSEANKDNAMLQNALAWELLTDPMLAERDLPLAESIANRANDAAGGNNPDVLDTLARAQFMNGEKDKALATETKALSLAPEQLKGSIQAAVESYKKGEAPKTDSVPQ